MGDFGTTKSEAQTTDASQATTNPWAAQEPYLKDLFSKGQNLSNATIGDQVAQLRPEQIQSFKQMVGYGNSNQIPGTFESGGNNLYGSGQTGVTDAMAGYRNFNPEGSVAGTIADAGLYADNPYMSGMVDAAMRDSRRATYEGQLPANARAAAMSGNTNSSKRHIADAVAERGLADRTADVSAGLRGGAYSQGLGLAQDRNQFNTNANLTALGGLGGMGTSAAGLGAGSLSSSLGAQGQLFDMANAGGAGLRSGDQAALDNENAKRAQQWQALQNYYNIVGANKYGGSVDATGSKSVYGEEQASPAAQIGGILTGIGGMIPG